MARPERAKQMKNRLGRGPASPYDALAPEVSDEHPVDQLIERRFPQERLRRRIRKANVRLARLLGQRRQEWLAVEELWNDYRLNREKACFDLGYERGAKMGRAEALRGGPSAEKARPLVGRICQLVDEADLTPGGGLAVLLKAAWSFAVAATEKGDPPPHHPPASEPDPE